MNPNDYSPQPVPQPQPEQPPQPQTYPPQQPQPYASQQPEPQLYQPVADPYQYQASPPPLVPPPVAPAPIEPPKNSRRKTVARWLMIGPTLLFVVALVILFAVLPAVQTSDSTSVSTCLTTQTTNQNSAEAEELPTPLFNEGSGSAEEGCSLFAKTSPIETILNAIVFLIGGIAFLTWLPGMIIGIVLLATKPKTTA